MAEQAFFRAPIWAFIEQKFLALGEAALGRKRIYLDTNFWAMLRDHELGLKRKDEVEGLLLALKNEVAAGKAFCTFSGHTLQELMKHSSLDARIATAKLMDQLSLGFCLANQERLLNNEIISWFGTWHLANTYPLSQLAWAKPFFLMVDYMPPSLALSDEENWKVQTGFINEVWGWGMQQVLVSIYSHHEAFPPLDWPKKAAASINDDVRKFDHENLTLHDFYMSELNGMLVLIEPRLAKLYEEFTDRYKLPNKPDSTDDITSCGRALRRVALTLAAKKKLARYLPSIHVRSMLHALIRFDHSRKFKPNDLIDIEHAESALPHCNFFFTDKPHAHLIRSAKLDAEFGCVVAGNAVDALSALSP